MTLQDPDQIKRQAEFDRLMTAAHVHRRRGDYAQAAASIKAALAMDPDSLDAREFAADMLFAHGDLEKAADEYKRISEQDKSRASTEQKYATAILQIAEGKRQQGLLKEMIENPSKTSTPARNPVIAALLSGFPGLGHVYCYQIVKGVVLCVVTMLFWLLFWAFAPPMADYSALSDRVREGVNAGNYFRTNLNGPAVLFVSAAVATHIYAIVDSVGAAEKTRKNKETEPQ